MPILRKLKSLLGADDADEESERDVTVTVEHDPENEAAVKGTEVEESGEDADIEADADDDTDDGPPDADADDEPPDADADDPVEIPDAEGGTADVSSETDADAEEAPDDVDDATDVEASDDGDGEEATGSDESVDVLNGIGPAYAERLENAGIETVGQLAAADAATLAEDSDIAEGRIQGWIDQAGEY